MARIAGVDLPNNKRIEISLTYIFGIGRSKSIEILKKAGIDKDTKMGDVDDQDIKKLREIIENEYTVEGELRTDLQLAKKRLEEIQCYRGVRHRKGLPVRGQRTRTNSRTRKGKRRTVAGKKKAPKA
jgi:small subunit ribosomal protein S13